jgi:hypothetical protein
MYFVLLPRGESRRSPFYILVSELKQTTNLTLEQIGAKFGDEVRLADDSSIGDKGNQPVAEEEELRS